MSKEWERVYPPFGDRFEFVGIDYSALEFDDGRAGCQTMRRWNYGFNRFLEAGDRNAILISIKIRYRMSRAEAIMRLRELADLLDNPEPGFFDEGVSNTVWRHEHVAPGTFPPAS